MSPRRLTALPPQTAPHHSHSIRAPFVSATIAPLRHFPQHHNVHAVTHTAACTFFDFRHSPSLNSPARPSLVIGSTRVTENTTPAVISHFTLYVSRSFTGIMTWLGLCTEGATVSA